MDEWIPYGVFFDMTDVNAFGPLATEPFLRGVRVNDNVNGYTASQYYMVLNSFATDPVLFRNSFIWQFGGTQAAAITTLFNSYGY